MKMAEEFTSRVKENNSCNHGFDLCPLADHKDTKERCDLTRDRERFNEYCSQDFTNCPIYQAKLRADMLNLQQI